MSRLIDADALDKRIYNDIPISVFGSIKKMAAVREIIAEQPTVDAEPKWIPCSERLPAFGEDVLLSLGGRLYNVGFLVPTNEWKYHGWYHPFDDVFAWMPLPKPYKMDGRSKDDGQIN